MKVADLSPETREKIASYDMDEFREKHEGPFDWGYMLERFDPEFMQINGHHVLMHLDTEHHPHITILRCIESNDGQSLTIFLKDKTYGI